MLSCTVVAPVVPGIVRIIMSCVVPVYLFCSKSRIFNLHHALLLFVHSATSIVLVESRKFYLVGRVEPKIAHVFSPRDGAFES